MNKEDKLINSMIIKGNYGVLYEHEQWSGFSNNLDLLEKMEKLGWVFIHSDKNVISGYGILAERTIIELLFRRIKNE